MKVLVSAYACEPNKGSEPYVGWNWVKHLSEYNELIVVTRANNLDIINLYKSTLKKPENVRFIGYDLPAFYLKIKKIIPIRSYYRLWQYGLYIYLKRNKKLLKGIDIVHQLTFNEFRTPGYLWKLNKRFFWGPIGGAQNARFLLSGIWGRNIAIEFLRNIVNNYYLNISITVKKALKKAEVVMVADSTTLKKMPSKYKCKYHKLLETGISTESFVDKKYKRSDKTVVIWSGALIPRKGLPILINVANKLKDYNITFYIYGDGPYKDVYRNMIEAHNINNVIFKGRVSFEEMNNAYETADIFLFTSLRDTSGNVVIEAMSKSLPVIVLDHHGASDIVGEDGLKIKIQTINQIENDLSNLFINITQEKIDLEKIVKYQNNRLNMLNWVDKAIYVNNLYYNKINHEDCLI